MPETLTWTAEGAPRSARFDDIYFQPGQGLAETRAVFLEGCGLPEAWRRRSRFVVGELGFGTGLNILALLDLWRRTRTPGQRLHIFSVEAYPVSAAEAARALAAWPELDDLARPLLDAWPRAARGFHRLDLPALGATLDVAAAEVADALRGWDGRADAWFLDGFSPAKNPQMWRGEVLTLVAARSAPGARLATFTVAGEVRRGLAAAGFAVERRPGHGRKRQRLEARLPGDAIDHVTPTRMVIVGGGVAGAGLARAALAEGLTVTVIEGPQGASANPSALVTPAFDAGERAGGRLYAQALARAADLYGRSAPGAVLARAVVQLEREPRDRARFDKVASSGLYAPGALVRLDPQAVAARLGEPVGAGGVLITEAMAVDPAALIAAWTQGAARISGQAERLERAGEVWRVLDGADRVLAEAELICLAAGPGLRALAGLPLSVVRGQATWAAGVAAGAAAAWGGYATPTPDGGVLFGATHDRGDEDVRTRAVDDARNLAVLAKVRPGLAGALEGRILRSRAGVRATTPDRLPVAGRLPGAPGLYVLGGLGGRGFTTAPLLAEHVVAEAVGAPSPLPADLAAAVRPDRLPTF